MLLAALTTDYFHSLKSNFYIKELSQKQDLFFLNKNIILLNESKSFTRVMLEFYTGRKEQAMKLYNATKFQGFYIFYGPNTWQILNGIPLCT